MPVYCSLFSVHTGIPVENYIRFYGLLFKNSPEPIIPLMILVICTSKEPDPEPHRQNIRSRSLIDKISGAGAS